MTIDKKLEIVQEERKKLIELESQKEISMTRWRTENAALLKSIQAQDDVVTLSEQSLRNEALDEYKANATKKFDCGVEIKEFTELKYEESKAMVWCEKNFQAAIKKTLDKKKFEGVAKDTIELQKDGLITVVVTPKVMIPKVK